MFKKLSTLLAVATVAFSFSFSAHAETLTISVGTPTPSYSAEGVIGSETVSGTLVHVKFPGFIGFGLENLEISSAAAGWKTTMVDVYYLLPIPLINVTLGVGAGTNEPTLGNIGIYTAGTASQGYIQLGYSFGVIDVHLSQHSISSNLVDPIGPDLDTSSTMTAVGIQIGF